VSVVKIAPLADSSWIKLNKKFFCFFFFKKRNAKEKELANKLHCNSGLAYPQSISTEFKYLFQPLIRIIR
jgi:hypothetical protein